MRAVGHNTIFAQTERTGCGFCQELARTAGSVQLPACVLDNDIDGGNLAHLTSTDLRTSAGHAGHTGRNHGRQDLVDGSRRAAGVLRGAAGGGAGCPGGPDPGLDGLIHTRSGPLFLRHDLPGIFRATIAGTMPQFGLLLVLVLLPLQTLSGGTTPLESMPEIIQKVMLATQRALRDLGVVHSVSLRRPRCGLAAVPRIAGNRRSALLPRDAALQAVSEVTIR